MAVETLSVVEVSRSPAPRRFECEVETWLPDTSRARHPGEVPPLTCPDGRHN